MTALARCFRQTLRQIFREKETLILLFGASVLYAFFYPTPYLRQIIRDLPIVVVDRDHTAMSRQLTRWLDASEAGSVTSRVNDLNAAQDSVRAGVAGAVLLIPQDFERHVLRREPAYVEAYADASYFLVYSTALRAINGVVGTLSTGISVRRLEASGLTEKAALQRARPVTFVSWPLFNPLAGYGTFVVPAVFILILQQTLLIGIGALRVAEREKDESGTEPLWAILGGKLGATALIYLGHAVFMFGVVFSLYGFPMRASWLDVVVFLVPYFAAVTLLGLAIAELFDRPESSTVALAAMGLPALFLSGLSFPVEVQAAWVRALAVVLPSTFGIQGFLQLAEMGARFDQTLRPWGALWIQVVVYWSLAWVVLRYRGRSRHLGRLGVAHET
ncbi:MAG TPA: ABC transporter permease [Gemmatimonadales bacterium]|nr:ABC transporter permease [Gemmatimonadales bacterium]